MNGRSWLWVILVGGLLLRLPHLGLPLANDEIAISQATNNWVHGGRLEYPNLDNSKENTWQGVHDDPLPFYAHPPLQPLFVGLFVTLPIPLEMAVRLSTVVIGILSILAVYLLGATAFGTRAGLLAAALFAISKHSIFHYSFRTTKDALAGLLALLAFWLYLRYLKEGGISKLWIIGLLGGLSLLDRTSTMLWIALLTLALFMQTKKQGWNRLIPLSCAITMFGIWIILDYFVTQWAWLRYMIGIEAVAPFLYTSDLLYKQAVQLGHILFALTPPVVVILVGYVLVQVVAWVQGVRTKTSWTFLRATFEQPAFLLSYWIVGMFVAPLLFEGGGHHTEKYFYIAIPFIFVVAGQAISAWKVNWRWTVIIAILGSLVLLVSGVHDFLSHMISYDQSGYLGMLIWMLPFFLLPSLLQQANWTKTILPGLVLAFCLHAILFPGSVWTIANSQATLAGISSDAPVLLTKSEFVATALLVDDWVPDHDLDRQYRYVSTLNALKEATASSACGQILHRVGSYPLLVACMEMP